MTAPTVIKRRGQRFWVETGAAVDGPFGTYAEALQAGFEAHASASENGPNEGRRGGKRRPCMCCQKMFNSQGPHNRLCTSCRGRGSEPQDGWAAGRWVTISDGEYHG